MKNIKLATVAPELPAIEPLIQSFTAANTRVALGHSSASYTQGLTALSAGASGLTHTLNAMTPLHHRDPGLAGLISLSTTALPHPPFYSIIPDGHHLHPSIVNLLYRANPKKCMLITDSIELAGLPDGTYPGHAQIPHNQTKKGAFASIEGTDTLIGGCFPLQEGVRNLMKWTGCNTAEAVRTVTENVADFMGLEDRGKLLEGRRADFAILDEDGFVRETWVEGKKVWERKDVN